MFFSKLARILAVAALVIGVLSVLAGSLGATIGVWDESAMARYGRSPGRMIDSGIYIILAAVALGTLAEISFAMRKGAA